MQTTNVFFNEDKTKRESFKVFSSLKDFEEGEIVGLNDHVYIEGIHYVVKLFTLTRPEAKNDDKIFKILNIRDVENFVKKHYRYPSDISYHVFPHFKSGDYEAATRVIKALMKRSENPPWYLKWFKIFS